MNVYKKIVVVFAVVAIQINHIKAFNAETLFGLGISIPAAISTAAVWSILLHKQLQKTKDQLSTSSAIPPVEVIPPKKDRRFLRLNPKYIYASAIAAGTLGIITYVAYRLVQGREESNN